MLAFVFFHTLTSRNVHLWNVVTSDIPRNLCRRITTRLLVSLYDTSASWKSSDAHTCVLAFSLSDLAKSFVSSTVTAPKDLLFATKPKHELGNHTHIGKRVWFCCGSWAECARRQLSLSDLRPCKKSGDRMDSLVSFRSLIIEFQLR